MAHTVPIFNVHLLLFLKAAPVLVAILGEFNMTHIEEFVPLICRRLAPGLKVCGFNTLVGEPIKFVCRLGNKHQLHTITSSTKQNEFIWQGPLTAAWQAEIQNVLLFSPLYFSCSHERHKRIVDKKTLL